MKWLKIVQGENFGTMADMGGFCELVEFINYGDITERERGSFFYANNQFLNYGKFETRHIGGQGFFKNLGLLNTGRIGIVKFHNARNKDKIGVLKREGMTGSLKSGGIEFSAIVQEAINDGIIENEAYLSTPQQKLRIFAKKFINNSKIILKSFLEIGKGEFVNNGNIEQQAPNYWDANTQRNEVSGATLTNNGFMNLHDLHFDDKTPSILRNTGTLQTKKDIHGTDLEAVKSSNLIQSLEGNIYLKSKRFGNIKEKVRGISNLSIPASFKAKGNVHLEKIKYPRGALWEWLRMEDIVSHEGSINLMFNGSSLLEVVNNFYAKNGSNIFCSAFWFNGDAIAYGNNHWEVRNELSLGPDVYKMSWRSKNYILNNLTLKAKHLDTGYNNPDHILLTGSSVIQADKITSTKPIETAGSLKIETEHLDVKTIKAQQDLEIKTKEIARKDYEYASNGRLKFDFTGQPLDVYGHLQGNELEIIADKIINHNTLIGLTSTLLQTRFGFENRLNAVASLGNLTYENTPLSAGTKLINDGNLQIDKLVKMTGIDFIDNATQSTHTTPAAAPKEGTTDKSEREANGTLLIKEGKFEIKGLTNGGYAALGQGEYTLGKFINQQGGVFQRGTTQYFENFENYGTYCSSSGYTILHVLKLSDRELLIEQRRQAAWGSHPKKKKELEPETDKDVFTQQHSFWNYAFIQYLGKVIVNGKLVCDLTRKSYPLRLF
jgi:hypothetical protein